MKYVFKMNFEYEYIECNELKKITVKNSYDCPTKGGFSLLPKSQIGSVDQIVEIVSDSFNHAVHFARFDFLSMQIKLKSHDSIRLKPIDINKDIKFLVENKWVDLHSICSENMEKKMPA